MSSYLKPQSPLYHKEEGAYFYPLTTADQIIMEDGSRLNSKIMKPKAGFIYPLASSVVPEGFLLCDGAAYSRTEYPELFSAIGTIYGAGDGSTTFNVPNLATRVPVGTGTGYTLGATGGEEKHTLTIDEMPNHDHLLTSPVVGGGGSTNGYAWGLSMEDWGTFGTTWVGGSQPHNNMQPYTVVNYIIATGKNTGVSVQDIITGAQALPLGVEYGGTGATNAKTARDNLEIKDIVYNHVDNSDFTQWVAQVEFGSSHAGSVHKYAGDRWILDSGTVTGDANENGNGYSNIKLTGTIRQIIANPPTVGSVFVDMVSGTAEITYQNGEVTITSDGGVLKNVLLCDGEYTEENKPKYQPKGYGAELVECMWYFQILSVGGCKVNTAVSNGRYQDNFVHPKLRLKANTKYKTTYNFVDYVNGIEVKEAQNGMLVVIFNSAAVTYEYMLEVELNADL